MHVLGSDRNRDFVFVVNLVDVWVNAWMMQHSMEKVESKVFKNHAEVYLEGKHVPRRKTIAADIKSLFDRSDQINPKSNGTHYHVVNQVNFDCLLQVSYPLITLHRLPWPRIFQYFVALEAIPLKVINKSEKQMHYKQNRPIQHHCMDDIEMRQVVSI